MISKMQIEKWIICLFAYKTASVAVGS